MSNTKLVGLTSSEVEELTRAGKNNIDDSVKTRSISQIFRDNICTLFNFVNVVLAICVVFTGEYKNMLFMGVIIINVCIGIVQEIRSKKSTDSLAIVAASKVSALRDGRECEVDIEELVLGDIIKLGRGDQIPADCEVVEGDCQANESLLTGESDLIGKHPGDELMSGSFINSGIVWAKVTSVGADNYASKITAAAKEDKGLNSQIMKSVNAIIKYVSLILFPVGILLFSKSYFVDGIELNNAILSSVSALVGMIPEGLILLTSTVLALAVIRLARKNVLVQQLYCIETLARVDTLCLDKTGTITTGGMEVSDIVAINDSNTEEAKSVLKSINAADLDKNETAMAIEKYFAKRAEIDVLKPSTFAPFSSDTKWSGATFETGSYVMGAAQFVLKDHRELLNSIHPQLDMLAKDSRVLLLAKVEKLLEDDGSFSIEGELTPIAFICIKDEIRKSAPQTIKYFTEQGVDLKIISGDDPLTVSGIAEKVGVPNANKYIDATTLKDDNDIKEALYKYAVFGRVKPEQKKAFVDALQANHHTVAMTGDGVNDVMALKAADCSVAMAAGSDAARNVSHLVLVDNDFAHMPEVVAEGRQSIINLQRSGSLFLVKTLMSLVLGFTFVFLPWQYPFTPIQMTLFSSLCIGFPSFVLALEPNTERVRGHFLANCIVRSLPGGICAILSIITINCIGYTMTDLTFDQIATVSLISLAFLGLMLIIRLSMPYTILRGLLTCCVIAGLLIGIFAMPHLFDISPITPLMAIIIGIVCTINLFIYNILFNWFVSLQNKAIVAEAEGKKDKLTLFFERFF